jgi:hypothetical protein
VVVGREIVAQVGEVTVRAADRAAAREAGEGMAPERVVEGAEDATVAEGMEEV